VSADARIKITKEGSETYNLSVTLLKLEDTGEYEVKATNDQGTTSSVTKVNVSSEYTLQFGCLPFLAVWRNKTLLSAQFCVLKSFIFMNKLTYIYTTQFTNFWRKGTQILHFELFPHF